LLKVSRWWEQYRNREVPDGFYDQPVADSTARLVFQVSGIRDEIGSAADLKALDFGCGAGRYMEVFARLLPNENIVGVDVDRDRLLSARFGGFNCAFLSNTRSVLPFVSRSFDVVFSSNVIEHIPREQYLGYLREIHRVLKKGGRFVIGAPNYPVKRIYDLLHALRVTRYRFYYLFDDPTHCNKRSVFRVERDLKSLFDIVYLQPSSLPFESRLPVLHRERLRHLLRGLGNKFFGYCVKA
jgi:SAM-dependent methyltransferase